jgi:hypothetical protein
VQKRLLGPHSVALIDGPLSNIVTVDESSVSFHNLDTKKQPMQWVKKGQPGPVKARVHTSRSMQMVPVFWDAKGIIYTNYAPKVT